MNEHFLCLFEAEDEEDTIAAQEKVEGNVDHAEELDDLAKEGTSILNMYIYSFLASLKSRVVTFYFDMLFS